MTVIEIINGRPKEPALRAELIAEIVRLNKVIADIGDMLARTNEAAANAADKIVSSSEIRSNQDSETFSLTYSL